MNVSEQIIAVLDELCEKFGFVIDWSKDNIIPYVKELCSRFIKYEIITSALIIALNIAILVACGIVIKHFINAYNKANNGKSNILWDSYCYGSDVTAVGGIVFAVTVALAIIAILISILQINDIIKAICLPEIVFIEYIKSFI